MINFAAVPCCCNDCACSYGSQLPADVAVPLIVNAGTLTGGNTGNTSSPTGSLSFTMPEECVTWFARTISWQVADWANNGSPVNSGAVLRIVHEGAGTPDLVYEFLKLSGNTSNLRVFLGGVELGIPGGITILYDSPPLNVTGGKTYFTTCVSAPPGVPANKETWAWGGKGWYVRTDNMNFWPGNTIRLEWENITSSSLKGVGQVVCAVANQDCSNVCDYGENEHRLWFPSGSIIPLPPYEDAYANFPPIIQLSIDGFQNGTCALWDRYNDTYEMWWEPPVTPPFDATRDHWSHSESYAPTCDGTGLLASDIVYLEVFFEYVNGVYRLRAEWELHSANPFIIAGRDIDSFTAVHNFAGEPKIEDWDLVDLTVTASSFTSGRGSLDLGNYSIQARAV